MVSVRWGRSEVLEPPATPKVRWGRSEASGAVSVAPKVRWGRSEASGAAVVLLQPIADRTVDPLSPVTLTAVLAAGSATPDSYVWRRVSGAAVTLSGTGASITFPAPAHIDGTSVVIGVRGVIGGAFGPEQTVTVTALPQQHWRATASGWMPNAPSLAL